MKKAALLSIVLAACAHGVLTAQQIQVGANVNAISGIKDSATGDPFLQRQNEPSIAVSTRNPDHIVIAANDYRTVDYAGDPVVGSPGQTTAEADEDAGGAWVGVYFSYNRLRTPPSGGLVPGFPQDRSPAGQISPLKGYPQASDPVLAAGPAGRFYLGVMGFNASGGSNISVFRYRDRDDSEARDTIFLEKGVELARGSASTQGKFADKPSIAADISRVPGAPSDACGNVYITWTQFAGQQKTGMIWTARSVDCGETWSSPTKVNEPYSGATKGLNQGSAMVIDPRNGAVSIFWRNFSLNQILMVKSIDGGVTYSKPTPTVGIPASLTFDQPGSGLPNALAFRTNAFPTAAIDGTGRIYLAWTQRTSASGSPLIHVATSTNGGTTFTAAAPVDAGTRSLCSIDPATGKSVCAAAPAGAQVMPSLSHSAGKVMLLYYEVPGGVDASRWVLGMNREIEPRVAQLDENGRLATPSVQVSKYRVGKNQRGDWDRQHDWVNLPIYKGGTMPFHGDYIMVAAAAQMVPNKGPGADSSGLPWRWAITPSDVDPTFHAVWTDNRDVVIPANLDFTRYSPPGSGALSCVNPGSRNANVYTAEIRPALPIGSPQPFKELNAGDFRTFVVYAENTTDQPRVFRLTLSTDSRIIARFNQFDRIDAQGAKQPDQTFIDDPAAAHSRVNRTVYVKLSPAANAQTDARTPFRVTVNDVTPLTGSLGDPRLPPPGTVDAHITTTASITLNGDTSNPIIGNQTESHSPAVTATNPIIGNPIIGNPIIGNPIIGNPIIGNPIIGNAAITDVSYLVTNGGNTASTFTSVTRLANFEKIRSSGNHRLQLVVLRHYKVPSAGLDASGKCAVIEVDQYEVESVVNDPILSNPIIGNPIIGNPIIGNPIIGNPIIGNPIIGNPIIGNTSQNALIPNPIIGNLAISAAPADRNSSPTARRCSRVSASAKSSIPSTTRRTRYATTARSSCPFSSTTSTTIRLTMPRP